MLKATKTGECSIKFVVAFYTAIEGVIIPMLIAFRDCLIKLVIFIRTYSKSIIIM